MTLASGIEIPSQEIAELCHRYQVRELAIFGSAARGDMHPGSDIDIMVEFEPNADIGWEFFDLEEGLARIFGRKVDLGTKRSLKPWVRTSALREACVIFAA
jgi:predicted nucleotidyltransferase